MRGQLLAMGSTVSKGETERPIQHVDVAATAAELLGVNMRSIAGRPIKELLS